MRFINIITSAMAAVAVSAQVRQEKASIWGMSVQYNGNKVHAKIDITVDAGNIFCENASQDWPNPTETWTCNNDDYEFALHPAGPNGHVRLRLYHQLGGRKLRFGTAFITLQCKGNTCIQVGPPPGSPHDGNINFVLNLGNPGNDWP